MLRIDKKLLYPDLSYKICGLCFDIHNKLGRYRNEKQYSDALGILLKENKIKYSKEMPLPVSFEGEKERRNIPDFIIDEKIVLDLKAKPFTTREDYFQMQRYLKESGKELGLIVNFRQKYLYPKRILKTKS
ncbi:MAG: GxxExxY protein [Candidatus Pacebacteria bacterium]|nr:GxxExxY protein [Candidatus Paceibacterota bacterium]